MLALSQGAGEWSVSEPVSPLKPRGGNSKEASPQNGPSKSSGPVAPVLAARSRRHPEGHVLVVTTIWRFRSNTNPNHMVQNGSG